MTPSRREALIAGVAATLAGPAARAQAPAASRYGTFGIDLAAMDRSVAAGDDFARYVNGAWMRTATIPPDLGRLNAMSALQDLNRDRTRALLEEAASGKAGGIAGKVGDYYASLVDEAGLERQGLAPIQADLAAIAGIDTPAKLARALARANTDDPPSQPGGGGVAPIAPFAVGAAIDIKNPTRYLASIGQGGLGMPDRDYYLVDQPAYAAQRQAYRAHLAKMFTLAGLSDPPARAARVYALDERIARAHRTREANRDVEKRYNLWSRADFDRLAPGVDWAAFLDEARIAGQTTFLISQPEAVAGAAAAVRDVPLADWRDYLTYRVLRNFAKAGPKAFVAEDFDFQGRILAGSPEAPPTWKRAAQQIDNVMGQAVGGLYLDRYFNDQARAQVTAMVQTIKDAMTARIRGLDWMTPATKTKALEKAAAVRIEVGSERPLRDYTALEVVRGEAYANLIRAARFDHTRILAKLGKPVNRGEWSMNPQLVNAQSNPVLTKIMFPAGILQAPFFDPAADPAVNYGAIGAVMGHELSHQFDDQGAKFDARGVLNNWWTPEDLAHFEAAGSRLAAQYDAYEPLPGLKVNGRLTLGENIGDLGGLALAYDAYHASLKGRPAPVIDGFTGDQRFFMAWAQGWRTLQREAFLRQQIATDPHSPGAYRIAMVRNLDAWYAAFDVRPGQRMYLAPEARVKVW
jgi:putative endopeptidase